MGRGGIDIEEVDTVDEGENEELGRGHLSAYVVL